MAKFRPNLGQFWPKRAIFEFSQKMRKRHFFRLHRLGLVQKLANSNERIAKKMWKTSIFGHFGPKRPILDSFWPKWAKRDFFSKKRLEHFCRAYKPYLTAKFQKKVMNGFRESPERTNERTNERTDERTRAKFKVLTN